MSQRLFAYTLAHATEIADASVERGLFLVSRKECSIITPGTPVEVQATATSAVVYATSRGVHVGYVPRNVVVPPDAFPELPTALHGVWLPSLRHCRVYAMRGPNEADDGATLLTIRATEIASYEVVRKPLLMKRNGPQSWTITFEGGSDGDPRLETVTAAIVAGVLSFSDEATRRIRCPGALTPAERASETELKRFKPLQVDRDIVTEGRCHMDTCSWSQWLSSKIVKRGEGELTLRLELLGGTSPDTKRARQMIEWNRRPHSVDVICSFRRPTIRSGGDPIELILSPKESVYGALESATKLYFAACHSDLRQGANKAATHGYDMGTPQ